MDNLIRPSEQPVISPCPRAPLYEFSEIASEHEKHKKRQELLRQAVALFTSTTGFQATEEIRQLLRQSGLVNLFVFLRYICGYANAFTRLTPNLHLDMCNFYQITKFAGAFRAAFLPRKHAKDLAIDTPVLTANRGWTSHGTLQVGDYVFAPDGRAVAVTGVSERFYRPCLKFVFSGGEEIVSGETHLWRRVDHLRQRPVLGKLPGKYKYRMGNISYREESIVEARDLRVKDDVGVMTGALQYPEAELPIPPYILGAWLGDGHSGAARITCGEVELADNIARFGYKIRKTTGKYAYSIAHNGFSTAARSLGVYKNKRIPDVYFRGSEDQRMLLLQGLMDTDGTSHNGTATFSNISRGLADDVWQLATSLALRPRLRTCHATVNGEPYTYYQVAFQHFTDRNCFLLSRKAQRARQPSLKRESRIIQSIEKTQAVESSCVTVEGGMYLVGRQMIPTHNSTTLTYGGSLWDIAVDPDWEEVLASCIKERGIEFNGYVQEILETNDLFAWLYPELIPPEGRVLNYNSEMTRVPAKRTHRPNIKIVGVGGSIQGVHAKNSFKVDDLVGEHMLDSMNQLGADNEKAKNWFASAVENIPSGRKCIVSGVGTRYGPEDAWTPLWQDIKKFYGYTEGEPYEEKEDGRWIVYYRGVREDHGDGRGEQPIWPEEITNDELDKMMTHKPWQYWTQMMNMSTYSGLSEMIDYQVHECALDTDASGDFIVSYFDFDEQKEVVEELASMDVVIGLDPGASEKRKSVRTSKSAAVVLARNWKNYRFVLRLDHGFAPITQVFDWLFKAAKVFRKVLRTTNVEVQGPFRILRPIIREEEKRREQWLNFRGVAARGDKDVRIRANLQPLLDRGVLYALPSITPAILGEMNVFPDGRQKDILDALAIAEAASRRPSAPDDEYDEDDEWALSHETRSAVTGY